MPGPLPPPKGLESMESLTCQARRLPRASLLRRRIRGWPSYVWRNVRSHREWFKAIIWPFRTATSSGGWTKGTALLNRSGSSASGAGRDDGPSPRPVLALHSRSFSLPLLEPQVAAPPTNVRKCGVSSGDPRSGGKRLGVLTSLG